jgi:hypothetical protein
MSSYAYPSEAAALDALITVTRHFLPGYTRRAARQRARDFLAALRASGQPGLWYEVGALTLWVERHA